MEDFDLELGQDYRRGGEALNRRRSYVSELLSDLGIFGDVEGKVDEIEIDQHG
jgi:hypothetical protein